MPPIVQHVVILIARVLLSLIFIASGAMHIVAWQASHQFMVSRGMALESLLGAGGTFFVHVMLALAVIALLCGGLSLLLGIRARWGALLLIVFLIPTTLIFHNFWALEPGGAAYHEQMTNFLKNLGLLGGLLMVLGFGSGGFSVDVLLPRRSPRP